MDVLVTQKLLDILMISITLSSVVMAAIQKCKSLPFIKKEWHIFFLNLILSFGIGIPFVYSFYEKDLVIIDIRTSMEFMQGAIKNSKNIDFYHPSFLSEIKKLDRNRKYLIYCASGGRSKAACGLLESLDFQHVYELKGGFSSYISNK